MPWHKQAGSFDQPPTEIFQRAAVQASDFAADEEEIRQQLLDLPAVSSEWYSSMTTSKSRDIMRLSMSTSDPSVSIFMMCALGRTLGALVSTSTVAVDCSPTS